MPEKLNEAKLPHIIGKNLEGRLEAEIILPILRQLLQKSLL